MNPIDEFKNDITDAVYDYYGENKVIKPIDDRTFLIDSDKYIILDQVEFDALQEYISDMVYGEIPYYLVNYIDYDAILDDLVDGDNDELEDRIDPSVVTLCTLIRREVINNDLEFSLIHVSEDELKEISDWLKDYEDSK